MKHWWERHSNIDLGDYTQNKVEDLTGRIPLLLDSCMARDEMGQPYKINMNTNFFLKIYEQALTFEQQIKSEYKDNRIDLDR